METVLENDRRIRQWEKVERNMESTDTPRADLGRFSQRARRGCPGRGAAPAGEGAPGSAGHKGTWLPCQRAAWRRECEGGGERYVKDNLGGLRDAACPISTG